MSNINVLLSSKRDEIRFLCCLFHRLQIRLGHCPFGYSAAKSLALKKHSENNWQELYCINAKSSHS